MVTYAALRFTEDENIADRVYWYRCGFAVQAGERVLAPVGSHDRLQCARVERVLEAKEADAPYDPALLKDVAAPYGARTFLWEGRLCKELGGVRYDAKRFTRFGVFACLFGEQPLGAPAGFVPVSVPAGGDFLEREETFALLSFLAELRQGALLVGERENVILLASLLLELAGARVSRPVSPLGAEGHLLDLGYPQETIQTLRRKLR